MDRETRVNAVMALSVAAGAGLAPQAFLRAFGVHGRDVTGIAAVGWRLFAARNVAVAMASLRGSSTARDMFLPLQVLDQAVFWHAFATRSVPRRTALLAAASSGVIVVLDVRRRRR